MAYNYFPFPLTSHSKIMTRYLELPIIIDLLCEFSTLNTQSTKYPTATSTDHGQTESLHDM